MCTFFVHDTWNKLNRRHEFAIFALLNLFVLFFFILLGQCYGRAKEGGLGLGDEVDRGTTPGSMGDNLPALALGTGKLAVAPSPAVAATPAPTMAPTLAPTMAPTVPPTLAQACTVWHSVCIVEAVVVVQFEVV